MGLSCMLPSRWKYTPRADKSQRCFLPSRTTLSSTPFRGEVAGEQIRVDALNQPFEEFVICEHAFYSEWILFEIGHRFLSADRVVDKKPSLVVREGTCQGQFASALKCPIVFPMRRTNGREPRFVGAVFRVVREQPNLRIFAAALVGRSICFDEKIEIYSAKTPHGDLVTAQRVCKSERIFLRKDYRRVYRHGFVDEEQPDTPTLIIQEGSADRQLALCPQSIRICKMGRAGASDFV